MQVPYPLPVQGGIPRDRNRPKIFMIKAAGPITLPAKVTLLLSEDGVEIEITDAVSGVMVLEVHLDGPATLAAFGRRAMVEATATYYHSPQGPLGYANEIKHVEIDFGPKHHETTKHDEPTRPHEAAAIAPYLVEGWRVSGRTDGGADWRNHHCRVKGTVYRVGFRRYVHPETGKVWIK